MLVAAADFWQSLWYLFWIFLFIWMNLLALFLTLRVHLHFLLNENMCIFFLLAYWIYFKVIWVLIHFWVRLVQYRTVYLSKWFLRKSRIIRSNLYLICLVLFLNNPLALNFDAFFNFRGALFKDLCFAHFYII